ncbi:MAG: eukaryotic-like serine/threonine-protein kinase, partial [Frankiaceae bacterium]|nr:eukaryotic-like serine/threonine-protein kinase [Frankiaceae bacterium]
MEPADHLPGYVLEESLASGPVGQTWRARDGAGEVVVVKRLPAPPDALRRRLRQDAAVLGSIAEPHVSPVREVVEAGSDVFVVTDFEPGGNLAAVLAVRGGLSAHELVTLLAPLARALAAAHDRDVVHGAVTATNVVFSADGRPMLTDFGHRAGVGGDAGRESAASDDVRQLAELGVTALAGRLGDAPAALRDALESARSDDERDRPGAAELADLVLASCAAAPIGLVGPRTGA